MIETYCGDCLRVLPAKVRAKSVDLILTDLPYGTTNNPWDSLIPLDKLWPQFKRVLKPGGVVALNGAQPFTSTLIMSNREWYRYCWYWNKVRGTGHLNAHKQPLRVMEEVVIFSSAPPRYNPQMRPIGFREGLAKPYRQFSDLGQTNNGSKSKSSNYGKDAGAVYQYSDKRFPLNLLVFAKPVNVKSAHPTQKPVELAEYLIKTYTNPGDVVLDSTAGSFTTGVAAKILKRSFIGIEKDPDIYADGLERMRVEPKLRKGLFD